MPTSSKPPHVLLDTSAAVALSVADHEDHETTAEKLAGRRLGLAGHAVFETFSVLTRLPPPARRSPATVTTLMSTNFPANRFLSARAAADLAGRLASLGVAGGAVYDALVGAAAVEHGITLASRDRRAADTYRLLGVDVELLVDR
jgi:predicted nucleic acid-binding protein